MEKEETIQKKGFFDRIQGDKVIWMVFILLILYSFVVNFSATSLKVTVERTRLDIFTEHLIFVALAFGIVFFIYFLMRVGFLRFLSQTGFLLSMTLLIMLLARFHAVYEDSAVRGIHVFGFVLQVYEFVKIFMVMYLAWAVHAYKSDSFWIVNKLSANFRSLRFLARPVWKRIIYIHLPIIIVTFCIMLDGFSSAVFTATIMILTVLIGGISWKDIVWLAVMVGLGAGLSYGLWKVTDWDFLGRRWSTVESRIERFFGHTDIADLKPGTAEYRAYIDEHSQAEGAKIAIKGGGFFGKGPGRSTQKYIVPEIYSDYAFAFVIEEYGILFGAIPLLALYVCLLGRGAIVSRYCTSDFCKTAVAGLVLLVSGQAMLHTFVNVGLFPLTGQTLPLVSYGRSSLLMFSMVFGVLLCISKTANKQVEAAEAAAPSLVDKTEDEVSAAMDDLDAFESEM